MDEPTAKAHLLAVGTGSRPEQLDVIWSIEEVLMAMDKGHQFYTQSKDSGRTATVEKFVCPSCQRTLIRSTPDADPDNNLDNLPRCP